MTRKLLLFAYTCLLFLAVADANAGWNSGSRMRPNFAWDGAGRTTGIATSGRASHALSDSTGRLKESDSGAGTATGETLRVRPVRP